MYPPTPNTGKLMNHISLQYKACKFQNQLGINLVFKKKKKKPS